jgi:hypothetical protein
LPSWPQYCRATPTECRPRIDHLAPHRPERPQRPFLVRPDQPRIAGDIGGEDRRQPPLYPLLGHRIGPLLEGHHIAVLRC